MRGSPLETSLGCVAISIMLWATQQSLLADETAGEGPDEAVSPKLVRLSPDHDVWVDFHRKLVVVDGRVCERDAALEMFACTENSKEHESIVTVRAKASIIHTALLAVGAQRGTPVRFDPVYAPADGPIVEVRVLWTDEEGQRHNERAQSWIKNVKTGEELAHEWVFAGSGFWINPDSGERFYHGDGGDFICVSNFPSATLDLPIESSQAKASLTFVPFTERIPPVDTNVRLVLIPEVKEVEDNPEEARQEGEAGEINDE